MTCNKTLQAIWAGTTIDGMEAHLETCPSCRGAMESIERLTSELMEQNVPAPSRSLLPSRDVIRKAIRQQHKKPWRRTSFIATAVLVTASCIVGVAMIWQGNQTIQPLSTPATVTKDGSITVQDYHGKTFSAKIMLVSDPKRIHVGVTKYAGKVGQTVSDMVRDAKAYGGVNAGAFNNAGANGTAGIPLGITIQHGQVVDSQPNNQPEIGITAAGQLLCGSYTVAELKARHVQEAVSFGPVLVNDGQGLIQGDGGWGNAPRTAIGQRADGTIIFIVTDGRLRNGLNDVGATLKDIQNLMLQYGAVTAANLDGGSSSTMIYQGKLEMPPVNLSGERQVATAFLIEAE